MRRQRRELPHCGAPSDPRVSVPGQTNAADVRAGPIEGSDLADLRNDRETGASPATAVSFKGAAGPADHHASTIASWPRRHRQTNRGLRVMRNLVRHSSSSSNNSQGSRVDTRDAGAFVAAAVAAAVREAPAVGLPRRHPPKVK
jgi:hypothetical protein